MPALNNPFTQLFTDSAASLKSNVLKKLLIPSAIDFPRLSQSKVLPNEFNPCNAVFNAPAIVVVTETNNSGLISPFKKSANPFPKFSATLYAELQFMSLNAFVIESEIYLPI